ncbi:MAG TPA: hypothetical protein VHY30_01935 [Verrucomicrobiae bacterium]|jgi:hypothetical protein|nr:hypothetical protein [Verrucomicrobiae bacterium]
MSNPSEKMPVNVSFLFSDYVRLDGDTGELWPKLKTLGYADRLFIDEWNYWAIRFESGGVHNKNISLLTLLFLLNDLNVPFAEDGKQLCSPAEFMRWMQRDFILKKPFRSVGGKYKEYKDWIYKTHEPLVLESVIAK